jgi:uncharacterized protein
MNIIFINDLKSKCLEYFLNKPVQRVYLFGSYAREEQTKESDLDLLVELEYEKGIAKMFTTMVTELQTQFSIPIHLITENSISPLLKEIIFKERILIYEKSRR